MEEEDTSTSLEAEEVLSVPNPAHLKQVPSTCPPDMWDPKRAGGPKLPYSGHASHKFTARVLAQAQDPPPPPERKERINKHREELRREDLPAACPVSQAANQCPRKHPPVSGIWEPPKPLPRRLDKAKSLPVSALRDPARATSERWGTELSLGESPAISDATVCHADFHGMPLKVRSVSPERMAQLEKGCKVLRQRTKGWDPRTSKNGLFGSYGAKYGRTPQPPHLSYTATRGLQEEHDPIVGSGLIH